MLDTKENPEPPIRSKPRPVAELEQVGLEADASDIAGGGSPAPIVRWDHELIQKIVTPGATVLDLGCGRGSLLAALRDNKRVIPQGVEVDTDKVAKCMQKGVPVLQLNLDDGILDFFPDRSFDFVILEKTLQTVTRPEQVLREMLRVGRVGVVSFPNFGHWRIREHIRTKGTMPVTPSLPHEWYNTPNIRMLTVLDFELFCERNKVEIVERYSFADGEYGPMEEDDNFNAEEALYVLRRPAASNGR